jgi:hypothetical protein
VHSLVCVECASRSPNDDTSLAIVGRGVDAENESRIVCSLSVIADPLHHAQGGGMLREPAT